jgi:hypothetical protein
VVAGREGREWFTLGREMEGGEARELLKQRSTRRFEGRSEGREVRWLLEKSSSCR